MFITTLEKERQCSSARVTQPHKTPRQMMVPTTISNVAVNVLSSVVVRVTPLPTRTNQTRPVFFDYIYLIYYSDMVMCVRHAPSSPADHQTANVCTERGSPVGNRGGTSRNWAEMGETARNQCHRPWHGSVNMCAHGRLKRDTRGRTYAPTPGPMPLQVGLSTVHDACHFGLCWQTRPLHGTPMLGGSSSFRGKGLRFLLFHQPVMSSQWKHLFIISFAKVLRPKSLSGK